MREFEPYLGGRQLRQKIRVSVNFIQNSFETGAGVCASL